MKGRKPIPSALKLIRGNPGQYPVNPPLQLPDMDMGQAPNWLDDSAKTRWKELVELLTGMGVLNYSHRDALAAYCQAWAEFREATMTLRTEGRDHEQPTGNLVSHPAVARQRTAWKAIKDFSALFGLDPSSQSRIRVADKPADDLAEFLPNAKTG